MKRSSFLALAAAVALLPLSPAPAHAAPPDEPPMESPGPGPGGKGWPDPQARLEKDLAKLNLSAEQDQKIRALLAQARTERESRRGEMRAEFERLRALLDADTPDEAAVMAQVDKVGALKNQQHKAMLHTLLAIRAELTPEQRTQLKSMMREHGPGSGRWMRGHHRGGPPQEPPDEE